MRTLSVGLGERSYTIHMGTSVLDVTGMICRDLGLGRKAAIVTNTTVAPLYAGVVESSLRMAGFEPVSVILPDGEEHKNIASLASIYDGLISAGLDRGSFIVALGGGVVGDMAGFAAATYLRGIPFVQVPTTLLAQVDSSVGGKTGINHELGKNLIGSFYQPRAVLIDAATLDTLPEREYLGGLAEVIKYGIVLDRELFDILSVSTDRLLARDKELLLDVIDRSCSLKAGVVEQDEHETGLRAVLNYGHTFGHAVEMLTAYTRYTHGEAVAIGMAAAAKLSYCEGYATLSEYEAIVDLVERLKLPTVLPGFTAKEYVEALMRDKKVKDGGLKFVFNKGIGDYHFGHIGAVDTLLKVCGLGE